MLLQQVCQLAAPAAAGQGVPPVLLGGFAHVQTNTQLAGRDVGQELCSKCDSEALVCLVAPCVFLIET